jgi:hypothetical protein
MSRFNYELTQEKIDQRELEGRGTGEGANYKPYLTVFDFPSLGLVTRTPGIKTGGREQHLLSLGELAVNDVNSLARRIVDIREQYKLKLEITRQLAETMNIKHPSVYSKKDECEINVVMTTDFYFTVLLDNGEKVIVARTVKTLRDLTSLRTMEKLELERKYHQFVNINWGIYIKETFPGYFIKNCHELIPYYLQNKLDIAVDDLVDIYAYMTPIVCRNDRQLRLIAKDCDIRLGHKLGVSIKAARHFIATHQWIFDFHNLFEPSRIVKILSADKSYSPKD